MGESGNGRIQVRPGLGRDRGIERERQRERQRERGVVWTDWGCHGNPAAKSRQGQCGREAVCSRSEGMPPGGQLVNYTNSTEASTVRAPAENLHFQHLYIKVKNRKLTFFKMENLFPSVWIWLISNPHLVQSGLCNLH